jgi:conjugal transfer pilus assembly protein TrbC
VFRLPDRAALVLAALVLAVLGAAVAAQADSVADLAKDAQKRTSDTPVAAIPAPDESVRRRAAAAADNARQRGQDAMADRSAPAAPKAEFPWERPAPASGAAAGSAGTADDHPQFEGRLIVALSSSMPAEMVHDYMRQLAEVPEAIVVLRGFVGGAHTVGPTAKWVEQSRRVQPSCLRCEHYKVEVVVDPLVYRALGIDKVPAVAYAPGISELSHCDNKDLKAGSVAYGATSIESAVLTLVKNGNAIPESLVQKVRSRGWESKSAKHSG